MFANGMWSQNSLDILDAQSPHKVVFLLIHVSLRVSWSIMCLTLVYFFFGMQQNMVFFHMISIVLLGQFLKLNIKRFYLRDDLSVNYFLHFFKF